MGSLTSCTSNQKEQSLSEKPDAAHRYGEKCFIRMVGQMLSVGHLGTLGLQWTEFIPQKFETLIPIRWYLEAGPLGCN